MAAREQDSVETVVTYLEMTEPPTGVPRRAPCSGLEVRHARRPTVSFYRYLYDTVGEPWHWTERRILDDAALAEIIGDPLVEVNVLWADGVPAGYAELDRRVGGEIELAYFGLIPEFTGRGLGSWLLDWATRHAWRDRPRRLWVHTCDLDDPRALPIYQRAGFQVYDRRPGRVPLLRPAMAPAPRAIP